MRTDTNYSISDCLDSFPFPLGDRLNEHDIAVTAGSDFYERRAQVMSGRRLGLTPFYNLFHEPIVQDAEICELRSLHAAMDKAVLACYGWDDIALDHGFYLNDRKKTRYIPARAAQREIFTRLLALNQLIAAQEAAAGELVAIAEEEGNPEDEES